MSLGYSFEPRPNSHSLAMAISGMTIGFIKKQMLALKKTSLTRGYKIKINGPEFWAGATSKV